MQIHKQAGRKYTTQAYIHVYIYTVHLHIHSIFTYTQACEHAYITTQRPAHVFLLELVPQKDHLGGIPLKKTLAFGFYNSRILEGAPGGFRRKSQGEGRTSPGRESVCRGQHDLPAKCPMANARKRF